MNQIMIRLSQRPNLIQDNLSLIGIHNQQMQQQDINQKNLNVQQNVNKIQLMEEQNKYVQNENREKRKKGEKSKKGGASGPLNNKMDLE